MNALFVFRVVALLVIPEQLVQTLLEDGERGKMDVYIAA